MLPTNITDIILLIGLIHYTKKILFIKALQIRLQSKNPSRVQFLNNDVVIFLKIKMNVSALKQSPAMEGCLRSVFT